jgi:hypothetical protein
MTSGAHSHNAAHFRQVTPSGQRTMRTCLGAAAELQRLDQLPTGWADGLRWLHCEGYCLHRPGLAIAAMRAARAAGAQVRSGPPQQHTLRTLQISAVRGFDKMLHHGPASIVLVPSRCAICTGVPGPGQL